ncbi:putative bifunctional diguanylate cyclase/phosphodiesterase [Paraglaciecola sp. 2405UD69-4]|uniref:putative bifunctional diguanylate cyclase/phosphodiesterase n=1 Tax=Paraglaciecola sp. 2405UD69-4 TaxID=3391836 RepID=UPI0039C9E02A
MAASIVLIVLFGQETLNEEKLYWLFGMITILGCRLGDTILWKPQNTKRSDIGLLGIQRYAVGTVLTALMWSMYAILFIESMQIAEFTYVIVILSSLAGASASVFSASRFIAISYSGILLIPIAILGILSEQEHKLYLGTLSLSYCLVMVIYSIRNSRFTAQAIYNKNVNQQLVTKLIKEKDRYAAINLELTDTTEALNQVNLSLEQQIEARTQEVSNLSNLDSLTQLDNRKAFTTNLETLITQAIEKDRPLALLFIDLIGFKNINDTMGHQVGDSVLIQVTERISAFSENHRAGRWNGDEFLVALPYSDSTTALAIAQAMTRSISQPIYVHGNEIHLTASIGIAMAPNDSQSATELIQLADLTMCEQKQSSNNKPQLFSNDVKNRILASQTILEGLQHAIQRKQLYLCYQPIQKAKGYDCWAFEALLRWDLDGKFIGPDVFIPLAEKSGLIKEIGAWVLNRACMDAVHWQDTPDAAVSVNVSVIQLMDKGFLRLLDNCLQTSGLPPERLHLEVTESTFVEKQAFILQQLEQIRARNIAVSIDDFGTGYSSLSQLQTLPVNFVKIDKTFVDNIEGKGEAIIRATLFIARELGCKTIAEGVETKEQAIALSGMGVDYLQGYYFAKPMKSDALASWQSDKANTLITK